ncbi:acyl-CoA dehydrogenase family protein [Noviherbaspirillum massiliense]|uniref:acyl-CoA dehydrogenase family protein n=1 Tax=Noviherbaspirillum massiliense TaxID=1465823 RepID=UPI00030247EF|nr:acyl-CoA dehydrogenase family protein [Noviherbaspirillum massiliense]
MDFEPSAKSAEYLKRVKTFIQDEITPVEADFWAGIRAANNGSDWKRWSVPPMLETLKAKAKAAGLWNLFLPDEKLGAGLSTLDYAPIAEETGRSLLAPTVFNCNAPDSGNMEVLWKYGSDEQKAQWLTPLLNGEIRSAFCMTEPDVASSDATNMRATAVVENDQIILSGKKWWSSGIGDPHTKILIVMAHTPDFSKGPHQQHSMVLVPIDTPGVTITRMLPVFGAYDEPHGHGEVHFKNVRLPLSNFIAGAGRGFEIAQGRLGPGRIHHAMRCIGAAEAALDLMVHRGMKRVAFGKPVMMLDGNRERLAEARMAIDQARLLTLYAAWKIDKVGAKAAMTEISAIKVVAPNVLQRVTDMAIQIHGGAGVSDDTPLPAFFIQGRSIRIADGPDEVHKAVIAKIELEKRGYKKR